MKLKFDTKCENQKNTFTFNNNKNFETQFLNLYNIYLFMHYILHISNCYRLV